MTIQSTSMTPEILVPRLGDYLVEKGLITAEQLQKALDYQNKLREPDQPAPLIGQILIGLKVIDRASLDESITEQILQLRNALEKNNQELEQRVEERTAELREALEKLSELSLAKIQFRRKHFPRTAHPTHPFIRLPGIALPRRPRSADG